MNREIKPGTGKTDAGGTRKIVIFDQEDKVLYGLGLLRDAEAGKYGPDEEFLALKDIDIDLFFGFLIWKFPRHWAIKKYMIEEGEIDTGELLEIIDREIRLTEAHLREWEELMPVVKAALDKGTDGQ